MPALTPGPPERELQKLIELFLRAETAIINEIGRLRSRGLVDYHAVAALERVQAILRNLESDCWEYVPRMIEAQFYVRRPERKRSPGETPAKHLAAYQNARTLTGEQADLVQRLTMNLMGQLTEASATALVSLREAVVGRAEPDLFRRVGLEQTALRRAMGRGVYKALPDFVEALRREGVTAFVDKAGRRWSLHSYCAMASRTTSRQAAVLSVLTAGPDLFQIKAVGSTCKLCAAYEGRVYSKSGTDPDFPPLAAAFGKMDPQGPDGLSNTWLNLHPNCLHSLTAWTPAGRTAEEIQKIKDFSNPEKNPFDRDPRTEKQREAYRKKELARRHWLEDRRQWQRYREAGVGPGSFETFRRHKYAVRDPDTKKMGPDAKYKDWKKEYRRRGLLEKSQNRDILRDIPDGVISVTDEAIQRVPLVQPDGWSTERSRRLQEAHRDLLRAVKDAPAGTEAGAVYTPDMRLIERKIGEAADRQIFMPRYPSPHILVHNHPSGLTFSKKDIENFIGNFDMKVFTAVGNNGSVYLLEKTDQYNAAGFVRLFGGIQTELAQAETPLAYAEIINRFLKEAERHGIKFIARRSSVF